MYNKIDKQPSLDSKILKDFSPEMKSKLAIIFFKQTTTIIREIKESIRMNNLNKLAKKAHLLKGSCLALGAIKMSTICDILQKKANSSSEVNELLSLLESEFRLVKQKLK